MVSAVGSSTILTQLSVFCTTFKLAITANQAAPPLELISVALLAVSTGRRPAA